MSSIPDKQAEEDFTKKVSVEEHLVDSAKELDGGLNPAPSFALNWNKRLENLDYRSVKWFATEFKMFVEAMKLDTSVAKFLLLQSLDGRAKQYARLLDPCSWEKTLQKMIDLSRPSLVSFWTDLNCCKQETDETMFDFSARCYDIIDEYVNSSISDKILKSVFLENLNEEWTAVANSILAGDPCITLKDLSHKMINIESKFTGNSDIELEDDEVCLILSNDDINWSVVNDKQSLLDVWKHLMKTDPPFKDNCLRWIQNVQQRRPTARRGRKRSIREF